MGINGGLFQSGGLQQSTGLLKERWDQDGSTIINVAGTFGETDATIYTVTTGKTLYIKNLIITTTTADGDTFDLEDGSGGTTRFSYQLQAVIGIGNTIYFDTPLKFTDSIYYNATTSPNVNLVFTGWEE